MKKCLTIRIGVKQRSLQRKGTAKSGALTFDGDESNEQRQRAEIPCRGVFDVCSVRAD